MQRFLFRFLLLATLFSCLLLEYPTTASAQTIVSPCRPTNGTKTLQGSLNGANYTIQVPAHWNGTLLLYSHGYVPPFLPLLDPAPTAPEELVAQHLLQEGFALAGSSYRQNGTVIKEALEDQITLLNYFDDTCGKPQRTIAWGGSMGGAISAGLVQKFPHRFAGAVPACGLMAGSVGFFNVSLNGLFALNVLLANSTLPLAHITDPQTTLEQYLNVLHSAQQTPEGRARIALAAALLDLPDWGDPALPEPDAHDYDAYQQNYYQILQNNLFLYIFAKADIEARNNGNPSWNTDVNFHQQLLLSVNRTEVISLYKKARLDLWKDLKTLEQAPRIQADQHAVNDMRENITFTGDLQVPILTLHNTADPLVTVENEQAYAHLVHKMGKSKMLRQTYIDRAGHCAFTGAEVLTALHALIKRIDLGRWGDWTSPEQLQRKAMQYGPEYHTIPAPFSLTDVKPAFVRYSPAPFLRPYSYSSKVS